LDGSYLDALVTSVLAILVLLVTAGFFMLSTLIMRRSMAVRNKRSGFNLVRGVKRAKKDSKRDVLIAAAIAGYLQAEQERKL